MTLLSQFMNQGTSSSPFEGMQQHRERYQSIALIIMAIVVAPLAEEVFFRGMVYNALQRRMHFLFAAFAFRQRFSASCTPSLSPSVL